MDQTPVSEKIARVTKMLGGIETGKKHQSLEQQQRALEIKWQAYASRNLDEKKDDMEAARIQFYKDHGVPMPGKKK